MKIEDLERYLDRGDTLGFTKQATSTNSLGWILLQKIKPNERLKDLFSDSPSIVREYSMAMEKPYLIQILEMTKEAYDKDQYESNSDYICNEVYRFNSLNDVEMFLGKFDCKLADIKWPIEIGSP
jgi:hypothetical protein